jgi:acetyl-CoA synthetase
LKGEALVCFVVLNGGAVDSAELREALAARVTAEMGKALKPKAVLVIEELPKTRNAKVLRRIVRAVYLGANPGDLSSLDNPSAISALEAVIDAR